MKATDFMVGDYANTSRGIAKVIAVDKIGLTFKIDGGDFDIDRYDEDEWFDGVYLTEEVLEKIGFVRLKTAMGRVYYEMPLGVASYATHYDDYYCRIIGPRGKVEYNDVKYLHELQHVFRLLGIEKEITL